MVVGLLPEGTACGTYGEHFAQRGFEFFLLLNIVHASRWAAGVYIIVTFNVFYS
jgi:hypothetical protein